MSEVTKIIKKTLNATFEDLLDNLAEVAICPEDREAVLDEMKALDPFMELIKSGIPFEDWNLTKDERVNLNAWMEGTVNHYYEQCAIYGSLSAQGFRRI